MTFEQAHLKAIKESRPEFSVEDFYNTIHILPVHETKEIIERSAVIFHESQRNL